MREAAKNRRYASAVYMKYSASLNPTELEGCGLRAMEACLKQHDYGRQKFTTSYTRFVRWECGRELRRHVKTNRKPDFDRILRKTEIEDDGQSLFDNAEAVEKILGAFGMSPEWMAESLKMRFLEGLTYDQMAVRLNCSRTEASKKVAYSIAAARFLLGVPPEDSETH